MCSSDMHTDYYTWAKLGTNRKTRLFLDGNLYCSIRFRLQWLYTGSHVSLLHKQGIRFLIRGFEKLQLASLVFISFSTWRTLSFILVVNFWPIEGNCYGKRVRGNACTCCNVFVKVTLQSTDPSLLFPFPIAALPPTGPPASPEYTVSTSSLFSSASL